MVRPGLKILAVYDGENLLNAWLQRSQKIITSKRIYLLVIRIINVVLNYSFLFSEKVCYFKIFNGIIVYWNESTVIFNLLTLFWKMQTSFKKPEKAHLCYFTSYRLHLRVQNKRLLIKTKPFQNIYMYYWCKRII